MYSTIPAFLQFFISKSPSNAEQPIIGIFDKLNYFSKFLI